MKLSDKVLQDLSESTVFEVCTVARELLELRQMVRQYTTSSARSFVLPGSPEDKLFQYAWSLPAPEPSPAQSETTEVENE